MYSRTINHMSRRRRRYIWRYKTSLTADILQRHCPTFTAKLIFTIQGHSIHPQTQLIRNSNTIYQLFWILKLKIYWNRNVVIHNYRARERRTWSALITVKLFIWATVTTLNERGKILSNILIGARALTASVMRSYWNERSNNWYVTETLQFDHI